MLKFCYTAGHCEHSALWARGCVKCGKEKYGH